MKCGYALMDIESVIAMDVTGSKWRTYSNQTADLVPELCAWQEVKNVSLVVGPQHKVCVIPIYKVAFIHHADCSEEIALNEDATGRRILDSAGNRILATV